MKELEVVFCNLSQYPRFKIGKAMPVPFFRMSFCEWLQGDLT